MKQIGTALIALAWMTAIGAHGETTQDGAPTGNRFLLVVETSTASSRLKHGGRQAAFDLVFTGVNGQMREGDTLGLWTFNEEVFAGRYPMQTWSPTNNMDLATRTGLFLKEQPYAKRGRIEPVIKHVFGLMAAIKDVNVFIISDPGARFGETALGQAFKTEFASTARRAREAKQPVITTLVARNGSISNWYVTVAGQPIRLPAIAIPAPQPKIVQTAPAPKASRPPAVWPARPSIIMSGPNPKLGTVISSSAEVEYVSSLQTNVPPVAASAPADLAPNTTAIKPVEPTAAKPAETAASTIAHSSVPPVKAAAPALPMASSTLVVEKSPVVQVPVATSQPPPPPPAASVPAAIVATASLLGEPMKVKARQHETSQRAAVDPTNQLPALAATAAPSFNDRFTSPIGLVVIGILLLALVLFLQRFRRNSQASFISQSMDRR